MAVFKILFQIDELLITINPEVGQQLVGALGTRYIEAQDITEAYEKLCLHVKNELLKSDVHLQNDNIKIDEFEIVEGVPSEDQYSGKGFTFYRIKSENRVISSIKGFFAKFWYER